MNETLLKFLGMVVHPGSAANPDNYVGSKKINSNDLTLTAMYVNGAAYIYGVAFNQIVKVKYNIHWGGCFFVTINEVDHAMRYEDMVYFFETGKVKAVIGPLPTPPVFPGVQTVRENYIPEPPSLPVPPETRYVKDHGDVPIPPSKSVLGG